MFSPQDSPSGPVDKVRQHLKSVLSREYRELPYDPASLRIKHHVKRGASAAAALTDLAAEQNIDLMVMGTEGRGGGGRLLLGSVASRVARTAPCDVLTVGREAQQHVEYKRVMAPVDFSVASKRGLLRAKEWAHLYGAELDVVHAVQERVEPLLGVNPGASVSVRPQVERSIRGKLKEFCDDCGGPEVNTAFHIMKGEAGHTIVRNARQHDHDLVVLATHGRSGFKRFAMGSATQKVIRLASCPVLTVRPQPTADPDASHSESP